MSSSYHGLSFESFQSEHVILTVTFPPQGAIQGPEEFAEGLALGVRSLLGHAVGTTK